MIKWIAISDRLPDHTKEVHGKNKHTGETFICKRYALNVKIFVVTFKSNDEEGDDECAVVITHWAETDSKQ